MTDNQLGQEVAVFIDMENLRYSMLNQFGIEPDFKELVDKICEYGRPSVMRAYADFSEHPETMRRHMQVVGIEAVNVPVKYVNKPRDNYDVKSTKSSADMWLALDAIAEAADADFVNTMKTFVLVTGDSGYIKLVTQLRNRYGQKVIVMGVHGSVSNDLCAAAHDVDILEMGSINTADNFDVKRAIVQMAARGPSPMLFWSMKMLDKWSQDARNDVPGNPRQRKEMLAELLDEGVFMRCEKEYTHRSGELRKTMSVELDDILAEELGYLDAPLPVQSSVSSQGRPVVNAMRP